MTTTSTKDQPAPPEGFGLNPYLGAVALSENYSNSFIGLQSPTRIPVTKLNYR